MRRIRPLALLVVLAIVVHASACGDDSVEVDPMDQDGTALGSTIVGTWTLQSWESDGVTVTSPSDPTAVVNFLADGTLSGDTGCNRFGGTYAVGGDDLTVTTGATTRRACTDDVATVQEQALLTQLGEVRSARVDGPSLELLDGSGTVLLSLAAGPSGLDGTSWQVSAVNNGTGGLEASALSEALTAEFRDGTVSGSTGCNTFSAAYTTEDDRITVEPPQATLIGCEPEVAAVEARFLAALENATRFELEATSLVLRDDEGAAQVTFRPRP
jgi:heat shock protein HslJ